MKFNIRSYTWVEFFIWLVILSIGIWGFRFYRYEQYKKLPSYQIFMPDVDGMIIGSPVRYMGVQVGYIKNIKILSNSVYVKFVITQKDLKLPEGVIATVEFNGLGGSKSLEIYPPDGNSTKIIRIGKAMRLSESLGLLDDMFSKIDAIATKLSSFANKMGVINSENSELEINSDDIGKGIKDADKFVDEMIENRKNFQEKMKGWKYGEREGN